MLCDECHKHEASIYVTEITSQGQIEHHLCEFCATKLGLLAEKQNVFSINDFYLEFSIMNLKPLNIVIQIILKTSHLPKLSYELSRFY